MTIFDDLKSTRTGIHRAPRLVVRAVSRLLQARRRQQVATTRQCVGIVETRHSIFAFDGVQLRVQELDAVAAGPKYGLPQRDLGPNIESRVPRPRAQLVDRTNELYSGHAILRDGSA